MTHAVRRLLGETVTKAGAMSEHQMLDMLGSTFNITHTDTEIRAELKTGDDFPHRIHASKDGGWNHSQAFAARAHLPLKWYRRKKCDNRRAAILSLYNYAKRHNQLKAGGSVVAETLVFGGKQPMAEAVCKGGAELHSILLDIYHDEPTVDEALVRLTAGLPVRTRVVEEDGPAGGWVAVG